MTCTWATCEPRCWPGFSPGRRAGRSSCGWRTWIGCSRVRTSGSWPTWRALGLDWDGPVVYQSTRTDRYDAAIARLTARGLTYECFCTRREIREAASAPHPDAGLRPADRGRLVPGDLPEPDAAEIAERRSTGRPSALRLRAGVDHVDDRRTTCSGPFTGVVDDVVLRRNDGVAAYNLAVVVDDAAQGIDQIVRGDDLLTSAPRQAYLGSLLGLPAAALRARAAGAERRRATAGQAGRRGHPGRPRRRGAGARPTCWRSIAASLGLAAAGRARHRRTAAGRFDPRHCPREPWIVRPTVTARE